MDKERFAGQTIYFDFDSSVVKLDQIDKVNAVGDELKLLPAVKLLIDGHCDERGTEEYNRALGDRRALAAREVLVKYGIDKNRIRVRSWGEDMPADLGHDNAAWARNRRDEFILLLPPTN
ncbi:MAG: OmpA family protein [Verrucomicrobiales bacterium]|nr:OmpA family protein [Verrucomicrobiales bacterium]